MVHKKEKQDSSIKIPDYSPKTQESIDKIIKDMCDESQSEDLEQDIVALFEDVVKFFSGRSEDFINFDALSPEQKKELYAEIKAVIEILKKLKGGQDKQEAIALLSKGMLSTFSKKNQKSSISEGLSDLEQKRLKETFARITIQQVHEQNMKIQKVASEKEVIDKLRSNTDKFTSRLEKQSLEKKSASFYRSR